MAIVRWDPIRDMAALQDRVNRIFADVEKGEGLAGKVLSDPQMAEEVQKAMTGLNASLGEAQLVLQDLRKTTNTVAGQSQQSLEQFQAILQDIQKTTAALPQTVKSINQTTEAMPAMVLQMQETLRQIQRLVEGAQRPPGRRIARDLIAESQLVH